MIKLLDYCADVKSIWEGWKETERKTIIKTAFLETLTSLLV